MRVALVHGLGRTRLSLGLLALRLSSSGHIPTLFAYSGSTESHERVLTRLINLLRFLGSEGDEVGLVGHSFGGLLLREAVAEIPGLRVKHLVMLATPNRQPRLAPRVYNRWPFRIIRGCCGQCLANASWFQSLPAISVPYTIFAGTAGWRGRFGPFAGEDNDGVVAVSETILSDSDHPILVPAIHSFIMNRRVVHRLIVQKLEVLGKE